MWEGTCGRGGGKGKDGGGEVSVDGRGFVRPCAPCCGVLVGVGERGCGRGNPFLALPSGASEVGSNGARARVYLKDVVQPCTPPVWLKEGFFNVFTVDEDWHFLEGIFVAIFGSSRHFVQTSVAHAQGEVLSGFVCERSFASLSVSPVPWHARDGLLWRSPTEGSRF